MNFQTTQERKLIIAGGGALLFIALVYLAWPSIHGAIPSEEAIALKQHKLLKYRKKVLEMRSLEQKLITLQRAIKRSEGSLLGGKTAALAAVEVQQLVSEIIKDVGGQIRTTRILSPRQDAREKYTAVPIEISIQATLRQLVDILYRIHSADKVLRMVEIGIRTMGSRSENQTILSTMTVEGFMKMMES